MKKTIAAQVRAYINAQGDAYTPAKLADEVAKYQRDLPEGRRCKRQNIEQLLERDFQTVRYVAALAAAMGTTVETLVAGAFDETKNSLAEAPAPAPTEAPATNPGDAPDMVIVQYDTGGSMGNGFHLSETPPGHIKSWRMDHEWLRLNVPAHTGVKNLCIVTGFGPSMRPMFNPGDPLLLDRGVNVVDHDGVYFFRVGNEGFIKMIQRVPDSHGAGVMLQIISKNPDYPPYPMSPKNQEFEVLGKVLTVWRSEQH